MSIDDDLDRLLQRAFDDARPSGHEDTRGLRDGAVARAHGLRRRRRIGTGIVSAAATITLVGGVGALAVGGWPGEGTVSTASTPATRGTSALSATPTPTPSETAYPLGGFIPVQASLPEGLVYAGPVEEGRNAGGAVVGQACDGARVADTAGMKGAPRAVSDADRLALTPGDAQVVDAVHVTLTGWARDTGRERFADLQANRQACRFATEFERLTWPGRDPATTWMVRLGSGEYATHIAAQLVGDVIVAVEVRLRVGEDAARQDAERLSDEIVAGLKASSLPAATGR